MSNEKLLPLSDGAGDVLYSLFFRGALQSGEIPSKAGVNELREAGLIHTQHTSTRFGGEDYFTFLTAEGQAFAIKYLVNTRFGVPAGGYISSTLDALDEIANLPYYKISSEIAIQQKIADALDTGLARYYEQFGNGKPEKTAVYFLADRWVAIKDSYTPDEIRDALEYIKRKRKEKEDEKTMAESLPFSVKDGQVFLKDALIQKVQLSRIETDPRKGYAIDIGICNERKTSVKLSPEMKEAICDEVSAVLKKNFQPGGDLWNSLRRGF